jgi:hypothetical protein
MATYIVWAGRERLEQPCLAQECRDRGVDGISLRRWNRRREQLLDVRNQGIQRAKGLQHLLIVCGRGCRGVHARLRGATVKLQSVSVKPLVLRGRIVAVVGVACAL